MKFSVASVVAFAALVLARPEFTNEDYKDLKEGESFTLSWQNAVGTVKIELVAGPDENSLEPVRTITVTKGATGSITFTGSNLPSGNYAFKISDESGDDANYSPQIKYTGTGTVSSSSVTKTATSTVTKSTSASSTETETETSTETSTASETSTTSSATETTLTTTTTSTSASRTPTATAPPPNTNNGQRFGSSLALVLGTIAALVFFN